MCSGCTGNRKREAFLELFKIRRHRIVLVGLALLAMVPLPIVLAGARPAALLALAPSPLVLADARPAALLARAPLPLVLADARPAAFLAEMTFAVVRAPRSTLLDRTSLCLSWLFPPAASLFCFPRGCRPITFHVCVPCRPVNARHAIGALSARDVLADTRTEWRRDLADRRHSRASGRGHPRGCNCQMGRQCGNLCSPAEVCRWVLIGSQTFRLVVTTLQLHEHRNAVRGKFSSPYDGRLAHAEAR